ncbi:hypothetical protein J6590_024866, partial [Homalodisca vitripennis]
RQTQPAVDPYLYLKLTGGPDHLLKHRLKNHVDRGRVHGHEEVEDLRSSVSVPGLVEAAMFVSDTGAVDYTEYADTPPVSQTQVS